MRKELVAGNRQWINIDLQLKKRGFIDVSLVEHGLETMFHWLSTFGKHGLESMFPGLPTIE